MAAFRPVLCAWLEAGGRLSRRGIVILGGASLATPAWMHVLAAGSRPRIAFLSAGPSTRPGRFSVFQAIEEGLRERGHVQLQAQLWYADGHVDRLPALAQQVLRWQPDLIVTNLTPAALAMSRATRSLPIVMAGSGDPVAAGIVPSLARPGSNVTGVSLLGPELAAKSIELLHELLPGLRRLGVLANAADPFTPVMLQALQATAGGVGVQLLVERVREPVQYEAAFKGWVRQQAEAILLQPSLTQQPAVDLALRFGLPSVSFTRNFAEFGGLMAYAADLHDVALQATEQADRILHGTPPAQLPVQQVARFDLLLNLRTAQALGLKIPLTLLERATEVLE